MNKNPITLPEGYYEIKRIDLQKDKKLAFKIGIISLLLAVIVMVIGLLIVPLTEFIYVESDSILIAVLKPLLLIPLMFLYIILHEAVHGIFFKVYGKGKINFGITLLYAYAGSEGYYNKKAYTVISLSPIVILGIIIAIINIMLPREWFWIAYFIQVINISGAAGDLYVANLMRKLPGDTLTQDKGVSMVMYSGTN